MYSVVTGKKDNPLVHLIFRLKSGKSTGADGTTFAVFWVFVLDKNVKDYIVRHGGLTMSGVDDDEPLDADVYIKAYQETMDSHSGLVPIRSSSKYKTSLNFWKEALTQVRFCSLFCFFCFLSYFLCLQSRLATRTGF